MLVIRGVLQEEFERQNRILQLYERKVEGLPKGNIAFKKINGRQYAYLQYREGRKVNSQYIPNNDLPGLAAKVKERKKYEKMIEDIKKEIKFIQKALRIKI
ncbi:MAG: hypothetical protein AB1420_11790 [Bacillota bacterium]